MARHQNQQRLRITCQHTAMGVEDDLVFTGMGAGGDPHRPLRRLPLLAQGRGAGEQFGIDGQVELDRARHLHAFRSCTQIAEALSFGFGLHGEPAHFLQHRPSQAAEAGITARRAI
ncbi:hypothetical protein D3C76_969070 [compost metagenome]